jgi:hypothetical protein
MYELKILLVKIFGSRAVIGREARLGIILHVGMSEGSSDAHATSLTTRY